MSGSGREGRSSSLPFGEGVVLDGRFEIRGVLGEGGTGVVYEATRLSDGAVLALKVVHGHLAGDAQIRGRFTREAAILRRLSGKHLSGILDVGEAPDPRRGDARVLFMALPKIDGPSLDDLLTREGPLPVDRALEIVREVCDGLAAAHAQGVVHRDLKPPNVLLKGGKHAIVVDFGLAKIITGGGDTGTTALTQHNMLFGTPEYMAPEQARGDELDARCDVYAVGVILYQLVTGEVPFTGASPLTILTAHMTSTPVPPRERAPSRGISAALEAVILHAMAKSPADRYPTAAALAEAIDIARLQPDDPLAVRPQTILAVDETDGHAPTMPSPVPSSLPPRPGTLSSGAPVKSVPPPSSAPITVPSPAKKATLLFWWIIAAVVGIGVGVYLSLRVP